jgi:hypothetical protein
LTNSVIRNSKYDYYFPAGSSCRSIFLRQTDENEVENVIKGLKNNKSPGPDNVSGLFMNSVCAQILQNTN